MTDFKLIFAAVKLSARKILYKVQYPDGINGEFQNCRFFIGCFPVGKISHHFFALMPDGDTPFGFFVPVFEVELQGVISILAKRRI